MIEIDTPEDEALLLSLLPKLSGRLLEKKPLSFRQSLAEVWEKIVQSGHGESFGDLSEWQRGDSIIAVTGLLYKQPVLTHNTADFADVSSLQVIPLESIL